jgi:hypothetical protein
MIRGLCRILYIPDWVTFKWCKEQEEHYHIFLQDYAEYHNEAIDLIKEDAGVKAYDALQELKNDGGLIVSNYSGQNADLNSFINYVLSPFIIRGNMTDSGVVLNLNYEKYKEKLMKLIEKKGN